MQYMLLCCSDEKAWDGITEAQRSEIMQKYGEFIQGLVKSGHLRASEKLQPTATATTLRKRNGKLITSDGPFAETKEQLGGFHVIECKDLDEAIAIAARIPTLGAGGVVEVRPIEPTALR